MLRVLSSILITVTLYLPLAKFGVSTWYYANMEEITELFCMNKERIPTCQGSCYLKTKVEEVGTPSDNHKEVPKSNQEIKFPNLWFENQSYSSHIQNTRSTYFPSYFNEYSFLISNVFFVPPEFPLA